MGSEMNHMHVSDVSWVFAVVILFICALLVCHIVFTLWKQRGHLHQLSEQHSTIVHSLPMSLGMISTMTICMVIGAIMSHHVSAAYIAGLLTGVFVSGVISLPFRDAIPLLDGIVAGTMGGLMGVMVGVMIPEIGLYTIVILLTILFTVTWVIMDRRIRSQPAE
ncbi:hypothetical protein AOX59_09925 [Lentibacillus amyloliquefaciens]|uniref:Uncharacterized protein n=1 Tax=Lentibacillus amyloliquefaciens TaxID=1472767 RepID=A0A0U4F5P4_9BACI|nr:hypothetical protein AOX59_09925 [Lentibacillus amyloliquefaciens]